MSRVDLYVAVIALLAAYGFGTAMGQLFGEDTPPTVIKRVHIHTTTGCAV